jgi:hypothetical protein
MALLPMFMSLALHLFQRHHLCYSFGVRSSTRNGKQLSVSLSRRKSSNISIEETSPKTDSSTIPEATSFKRLEKSNFYSALDDELETLIVGT